MKLFDRVQRIFKTFSWGALLLIVLVSPSPSFAQTQDERAALELVQQMVREKLKGQFEIATESLLVFNDRANLRNRSNPAVAKERSLDVSVSLYSPLTRTHFDVQCTMTQTDIAKRFRKSYGRRWISLSECQSDLQIPKRGTTLIVQ